MLYQLSEQFPFAPWSLLRYVTVRSGGALITSLLLSWWLGPRLISWLSDLKFRQDYQPKDAQKPGDATGAADAQAKRGTPTMGGILIVLTLDLSVLLWARWNPLVILVLVVLLAFAGLGLYDDWRKVSKQNADGVSSSFKLLIQFAVGIAAVAYLWRLPSGSALVTQLNIPFVAAKSAILAGGAATVLALLLSLVTIVGASNAVNHTDGMDGLAIVFTIVCTFVFLVMAYVAGNAEVHFSVGIATVKAGAPVQGMADAAEEALANAKQHAGKNAITCFGQTVGWQQWPALIAASDRLGQNRADLDLSTGYVYSLIQFIDMHEAATNGKPLAAVWRSRLAYRTRRMLLRNTRLPDDAARQKVQTELMKDLAVDGIERHAGAFRIPLFNHLYQFRDR
jgi:UDP-N-acetylmuramyl pentapeptide phosphotransferase/UDP-N-acetylglucosamine-1-phosphate transferase